MNFQNVVRIRTLLFVTLILIGCTRKGDERTNITMGLPTPKGFSTQALSAQDALSVVVVNVSGPGIGAPIIYFWENHCHSNSGGGSCYDAPPMSIVLNVPNGPGRLVQFLGVYENSLSHLMTFAYGEGIVNLTGGTQAMGLTASVIGTGTKQARIVGRYIPSNGAALTGSLVMKFQPPTASPAMVLDTSQIFGGWFSAFTVQGAEFQYWVEPQHISVGKFKYDGLNFYIDNALVPTSNSMMQVKSPDNYRRSWGNGPWEFRPGTDLYYGFFGPGASGHYACYNNSVQTFNDLNSNSTGTGSNISWDPGTCGATNICVVGGLVSSNANCTTGTNFVEYATFMHGILNYSSMDESGGFKGPFVQAFVGSNYSAVSATQSGTNVNLAWNYLPQVISGAGAIGGASVFYKPNSTNWEDFRDCNFIGERGFVFSGDAAIPSLAYTIGGVTAGSSGMVALCPYRLDAGKKIYIGRPALTQFGSNFMIGGAPDHFGVIANSTVAQNGCNMGTIQVLDANGNPANVSMGLPSFTLSGAGNITVSTASDCAGASASVPIGGIFGSQMPFYYLGWATGSGTISVSGAGISPSSAVNVTILSASAPTQFAVVGPTNIMPNNCAMYILTAKDASGLVQAMGAVTNYTMSATAGSLFSNYTNCQTGSPTATTINVPSGTSSKEFYYSTTVANSNPTISMTYSSGSNLGPVSLPISVGAPGPIQRVQPQVVGFAPSGSCISVGLRSDDSYGNPSPAPSNLTVNLSDDQGGSFYPTGACSGAITTAVINSGTFSTTVYYRKTGYAGPVSIATSGAGLSNWSSTINLNPDHVIVQLPGQTWSTGNPTATGGATPVASRASFNGTVITFNIVDQLNNTITNPVAGLVCNMTFNPSGTITVSGIPICTGSGPTVTCTGGAATGGAAASSFTISPFCTSTFGGFAGPVSASFTINYP